MDVRLHTGRVQAQIAPLGHLGPPGQFYHPVVQLVQRLWSQRVREAG